MKKTYYIPEGCKWVNIEQQDNKIIVEFEQKFLFNFKRGDILYLYSGSQDVSALVILKEQRIQVLAGAFIYSFVTHEVYDMKAECFAKTELEFPALIHTWNIVRPATEEEAQILFDALAKEGKRWNAEEKRIEDLPRWRAEIGKIYWRFSELGKPYSRIENRNEFDNLFYEIGNYYQTREEAEKSGREHLEYMKAKLKQPS